MLFYLQAEEGIPPKTPFFPFLWHATRNSCRRKKLCNWGLLGSSWLVRGIRFLTGAEGREAK